jgi:methylthioribose-1-phosphate isomerase
VHIIDQSRLPHVFETLRLDSPEAVAEAIQLMRVRGAPADRRHRGLRLALPPRATAPTPRSRSLEDHPRHAAHGGEPLVGAHAHARELKDLKPKERGEAAWIEAQAIADEDVALNEAIGRHGLELLVREHASSTRRSTSSRTATPAGSPPSTGAR